MSTELPALVITAAGPGYDPVQSSGPIIQSPAIIFSAQQQQRNNYYFKGLWREMLIKLADENYSWTRGNIDKSVAPGFTRDLQSVAFADSNMYFDPGLNVGLALHNSTIRFRPDGVTTSPGLTGGKLTPVAALGHFVYGKGTATETSIGAFGLNSSHLSSPVFDKAVASAPIGVSRIKVENIPFTPAVQDWQLASWVENTSLSAEGNITKSPNGSFKFDGNISAGNITYTAPPSGLKNAIGDKATAQLENVAGVMKATPFEIVVKGVTPVSIDKKLTEAEAEAYTDSLSFVATANEAALKKYGANLSKISTDLQANISGKKVKSYADAMKTFEKVRANPKMKLNAQDTQAVVNALNALDKATFADNITRLGKSFGIVGKIVQADAIREKAVSGYQTGDWKPLMLELEAMALSAGIGALLAVGIAFTFPVFATATAGIVTVSLMMAITSAFIDDKTADEINQLVF
ncbi:lipid II-degrading bacteriocin [Pseudomonas sp. 25 R 14]|uniref:lipid II-degrading bacteriocin n=1 Tax=Pseudomonas sp. 25 R 14 TaxID=1844109 RepID=UPI0008121C83|nr:lipid II-degrading bacteriocin [Pseudomonas sp. 25 R 14]CRM30824.1 Colicin-A [Pseudomonas sp. 25 R 14]